MWNESVKTSLQPFLLFRLLLDPQENEDSSCVQLLYTITSGIIDFVLHLI